MPLPNDFSYTENLQDGIKRLLNHQVNEWFSDVTDNTENTSRASLKRLCYHLEQDSIGETTARIAVFDHIKGSILEKMLLNSLPSEKFNLADTGNVPAVNKPKINLFFTQRDESLPKQKNPVRATISFRLIDYVNFDDATTDRVITTSVLRSIALAIKREFHKYHFVKGSLLYTCNSPDTGFFGSEINVTNERDAFETFRKMHALTGKTFNDELVRKHETPKKHSITTPTKKVKGIDGKQKSEPRRLPVAIVHFRHAVAECGLNTKIPLFDSMGLLHEALVK